MDPAVDGLEVIGRAADRLRASLAVVAEHHGDDELAVVTEFLAIVTMLIAEEEGFADTFRSKGAESSRFHRLDMQIGCEACRLLVLFL